MSIGARRRAQEAEQQRDVPPGPDERFSGYGVMGLPFASGHYLAMRRFPSNPFGAPYSSVWHRDPAGVWTFYDDAEPAKSCPRFFDAAADTTIQAPIALDWTGDRRLEIAAGPVRWSIDLTVTPATAMMTAVGAALPDAAWESTALLVAMSRCVRPVLAVGRVRLVGAVPNGQWFTAAPKAIFAIRTSTASIGGTDLGPLGPLPHQARLGDFWLPQRGLFMVGGSRFEAFDPRRHRAPRPSLSLTEH